MKRSLPDTAAPRARVAWKAFLRPTAGIGVPLSFAVIFLALSLALGCAGSLEPGVGVGGGVGGGSGSGSGGAPGSNGCETAVFTSKCISCHSTAGPAGGLDLQAANVASRMVGKPTSSGLGAACSGKGMLLNAGSNPATGIFIDKITKMDGDPLLCGSAMPLGNTLTPTELTCLMTFATAATTASPAPAGDSP
jgi:hypothetical protein